MGGEGQGGGQGGGAKVGEGVRSPGATWARVQGGERGKEHRRPPPG